MITGQTARKKTKPVHIGSVQVGGDAPVIVQSMTCTDTKDIGSTVRQIRRLEKAGCEIVRVAVPDREAAAALPFIKKKIGIPLVADIHFDHRLALAAIASGADGVRINPGNIKKDGLRIIARAARESGTAIRIGINAGSLEKGILNRYGGPTAEALVESALNSIALFEDAGFHNLKVSLKSSDVPTTLEAYRSISRKIDYPLHLGVTEAGSILQSCIKSSMGIGFLLYEGIGDTIRVSVTGDPVSELRIAYGILRGLNIRMVGPEIISCPTCGRCGIDLVKLVQKVESRLAATRAYVKIALMGCVVNGPGEAAGADIGIAAGRKGSGLLFKKGRVIRKLREKDFIPVLLEEIENLTAQGS
ncbi:MAG: flavodoxin-dependent (E)-4-hydroxy-3-methylbut-2-enyl-diphosphate synthase [Syntrophales bacterium]